MSMPLTLGCLWVVAATITACLPLRGQFVPGLSLLVIAPVLLVWIGLSHGWLWVVLGLCAVMSMFRRPLTQLFRRVLAAQGVAAEADHTAKAGRPTVQG